MAERRKGHVWQPIRDMSPESRTAAFPELDALLAVWRQQRARLDGTDALREFQARLVRSWSIETGILERLYTLDEAVTLTLVEQGFDASLLSHGDTDLPAQQLVDILRDHQEVAEGLFTFVKGDRQLSTSYVRELHQALTRHQPTCDALDPQGNWIQVPLRRGDWKLLPNNPGDPSTRAIWHQYCPPEQVASEMDRLVAMHLGHGGVAYPAEAAWLHHRFTQIHPFQDGNGRVARALASLVCIRAGGFPLVVHRRQKDDYIRALEAADEGELGPLTEMVDRQQRDAFVRAVGLAHQVMEQETNLDAIVADARRRFEDALLHRSEALRRAVADLVTAAHQRLREVADTLNASLPSAVCATAFQSGAEDTHWFRAQIDATARNLGYRANLTGPKSWVHLRLQHEDVASLVVSFHHVGRVEDGVVATTAFLTRRDRAIGGREPEPAGAFETHPACEAPLTFTAGRDPAELRTAFSAWLDRAVTIGLDRWRRSI